MLHASTSSQTVVVALDSSLADRKPEVQYVFRTLLDIAGYPLRFTWSTSAGRADIAYGPTDTGEGALFVRASDTPFTSWCEEEPSALRDVDGLLLPEWGQEAVQLQTNGRRLIHSDIIRLCYWLLTGAGERPHRRDRWDNIDLEGSFLLRSRLLQRPLVSLYGAWLRRMLSAPGRIPLDPPWATGDQRVGFALTHDVDYPEMIRWVELLRLAGGPGTNRGAKLRAILTEPAPFWRFQEWVDLAGRYGGRPTFYFMAARGSLPRYAMGTPDAFYDIASPRFDALFSLLRDRGCEIGLHASFEAYRSADQLREERTRLAEVSRGPVTGNRHHYWHLDPDHPHRTLRAHEAAGLTYDSSLAFEYYPGFRRGICHPYQPWDPEERRALESVQLPPAWMDDHFHRRRVRNDVSDPEAVAADLMEVARQTRGIMVVDYHVRGMNRVFFPRYGPWLEGFLARHADSSIGFSTGAELAEGYREYRARLKRASRNVS